MYLNRQNAEVEEWMFFKQVKYQGTKKIVANGAFKNVYPTVKTIENSYNPKMPSPEK